jgi:hypothetical protein
LLNFDEDFKNFKADGGGSDLSAIHANRENLKALGLPVDGEDTVFGAKYVYCAAHRKTHSTGWCTVRLASKRPLKSENRNEAIAEVAALGYPTND